MLSFCLLILGCFSSVVWCFQLLCVSSLQPIATCKGQSVYHALSDIPHYRNIFDLLMYKCWSVEMVMFSGCRHFNSLHLTTR